MKNIWKKIGLALMALTISSQSHALILIEPLAGYDFSISGENNPGGPDFDFAGMGYGLRLGLSLSRIMFGLSYDMMNLDFEPNNGVPKYGVDQTNFGIFAGWNPELMGFRFWAEYFFDVDNDVESFGKDSGDGWGLGIGYKFMKFLAVNAEYRSWTMDHSYLDTPMDQTGNSIFLSVSLPFELL